LCIGAHKGGTTWLYQQLDSHPAFWMPPFKELHYFDQLSNVERASSPRCRDERDLRFLESIKNPVTSGSVLQERAKDLCRATGRASQRLACAKRFLVAVIPLGLAG
jgi:hypothetical protein